MAGVGDGDDNWEEMKLGQYNNGFPRQGGSWRSPPRSPAAKAVGTETTLEGNSLRLKTETTFEGNIYLYTSQIEELIQADGRQFFRVRSREFNTRLLPCIDFFAVGCESSSLAN